MHEFNISMFNFILNKKNFSQVKIELELIDKFSELITTLENSVDDCTLQYSLIELVRVSTLNI